MKLFNCNRLILLLICIQVIFVGCNSPNVHVAFRTELLTKFSGYNILKMISNQEDGSYALEDDSFKCFGVKGIKIIKSHSPKNVLVSDDIKDKEFTLNITFEDLSIQFEIQQGDSKFESSLTINKLHVAFVLIKKNSPKITAISFEFKSETFIKDKNTTFSLNGLLASVFEPERFKVYINDKIRMFFEKDFQYQIINKASNKEGLIISNVEEYKLPYVITHSPSRGKNTKIKPISQNYYIVTDWLSTYDKFDIIMDLKIFISNDAVNPAHYHLSKDIAIIVDRHFLIVALIDYICSISHIGFNSAIEKYQKLVDNFTITQESINTRVQVKDNGKIINVDIALKVTYEKNLKVGIEFSMDTTSEEIKLLFQNTTLQFDLDSYLTSYFGVFGSQVALQDALFTFHKDCFVIQFNSNIEANNKKYLF